MREDAFRAFLTPRLSARAVGSYLSNVRAVESLLGLDVDAVNLREGAVAMLCERLRDEGMPRARASDCGSALRQYAAFFGDGTNRGGMEHEPAPAGERSSWIAEASVAELLRSYAQISDELRDRGVVRTGNGPIGDYAELLFCRAFGWTLAGNSAAGYDAVDAAGARYQIKARRLTGRNPSRQLSALRRLEEQPFQTLAAVLFDEAFDVHRAVLLPYDVVVGAARWTAHTNSWRLILSDRLWTAPGARDVTAELRTAQAAF